MDPFNEGINKSPIVDKRIGTSYQVVKEVHDALAQIIFVANNIGLMGPKEIELRESDDYQWLQYRRQGEPTWKNLVSLSHLARSLVIPPGTSLGVDDTPDAENAYARTKGEWVLALTKAMLGQANGPAKLDANGKVPLAQLPEFVAQVQPDWNATSGMGSIKNKPTIFSGQYADLVGKPSIFSGQYADLVGKPALFSGNYADLAGKPALFSGSFADLTGKPTLFSGSYIDLRDKPTIPDAQVQVDWNATSGIAQIRNKPTIPAAQVQSDWLATSGMGLIKNKPQLFSGAWADLTGKPTLFSGSYNDLTDKPQMIQATDLGVPNGIAQLDSNGKLLASQLPDGLSTGGGTGGTGGTGNTSSGTGLMPMRIADGTTFVIPDENQGFTSMTLTVDGTLQVDGYLIEV